MTSPAMDVLAECAARELRPLQPGERVPATPAEAHVMHAITLLNGVVAADVAITRASHARVRSSVLVGDRDRSQRRAADAVHALTRDELRALVATTGEAALLQLLAAAGVNAGWLFTQISTSVAGPKTG